MRDIVWGVVLIAIGLVRGDSVFLGDLGVFAIVFDALGVFFIGRGVVRLSRAKQSAASPPSSPSPPSSLPPTRPH